MSVQIRVGDCLEQLSTLPEESVHCVVTSPPYWGLRDYGVEGAIGLEPTLQEHLGTLVTVFREVRRVLRSDGTLWLNYGDSYPSGDRSTYRSGASDNKGHLVQNGLARPKTPSGLKPKDLVMMPARVALALQADGWWLRSEIVWHKPNPMPESVRDRPTSAHEKLFLLTKSARYFYDAEAVRRAAKEESVARLDRARHSSYVPPCQEPHPGILGPRPIRDGKQRGHGRRHAGFNERWDAMPKEEQQANGANLRNVWTIATHPFPGAHFATFPPKLVEPCIKAGTSEKGCCPECGAPWTRQVEDTEAYRRQKAIQRETEGRTLESQGVARQFSNTPGVVADRTTKGWEPSCEHDTEPVPATVLDPFAAAEPWA